MSYFVIYLVYGEGITLAKHIAIVLVAIPCIMISSYGCFHLTNLIIPLRVSESDEILGLDISMHGVSDTLSLGPSHSLTY